jgi:hypothetical protein
MSQAPPYTITFTPAARRRLGKLPLSAASALYEHLIGPVAGNPHRLGKPLDAPLMMSGQPGAAITASYTSSMTVAVPSRCWQLPTAAT